MLRTEALRLGAQPEQNDLLAAIMSDSSYDFLIDVTGDAIIEMNKKQNEKEQGKKAVPVQCISLAWGPRGNVLFAGFTDNTIRVWNVEQIA